MYPQGGLGVDTVPMQNHTHEYVFLARVVDTCALEHSVTVMIETWGAIGFNGRQPHPDGTVTPYGVRCQVLEHRAGPDRGTLDLPRKGDWGLVVCPLGTTFSVWLGSLYQNSNKIFTAGEQERIDHHDSGVWSRIDKDANVEWSHPSGTFVRVGDGPTLSTRTKHERQGTCRRTVDCVIPEKPAPTMILEHSSGLKIQVNPDGSMEITVKGTKHETVEAGVVENFEASYILSIGTNGSIAAGGELILRGDAGTKLGMNAADFIVLKAGLDKLIAAFNAHVHAAPGGSTGGPTVAIPPTVPGTDCTQNAKAG